MFKIKKIAALFCALVMMVSVGAISASAAAVDTRDEYLWLDMNRMDYTNMRQKGNNTPVYIKAQPYTLPYNGFYVSTQYSAKVSGSTLYEASAGHKLNSYNAYTIRSTATSTNLSGYWVRIRGHYIDPAYTWGDVYIAWSPDTAGSVPSLN